MYVCMYICIYIYIYTDLHVLVTQNHFSIYIYIEAGASTFDYHLRLNPLPSSFHFGVQLPNPFLDPSHHSFSCTDLENKVPTSGRR